MNKFFKNFGKRKLITGFLIGIILIGAGFFVYQSKFKADIFTEGKTYSVSGFVTDGPTGNPLAGKLLNISFIESLAESGSFAGLADVLTGPDGFYAFSLKTEKNADFVSIKVDHNGYTSSYFADFNDNSVVLNVKIWPIKYDDAPSTKVLDSVSAPCRQPFDPNGYSRLYHPGDYKGKLVSGVLFCVREKEGYLLDYKSAQIYENARQIVNLIKRTGLSYAPKVYIVDEIYWDESSVAAYAPYGKKEIVIEARFLQNLDVITHEFWHLLDWEKGSDSSESYCYASLDNIKKHCPTSFSNDFVMAYIILKDGNFINGYALKNFQELSAEIFKLQQTPDTGTTSQFTWRQRLIYDISNAQIGNYEDGFINSFLKLPTTITQQNAAMYAYKFVADKSLLDQAFPGTLNKDYSYETIKNGTYMSEGVGAFKLICPDGRPVGDTRMYFGSATGITRVRKDSGVFPNGSGDLFDTTGTLFVKKLPINSSRINIYSLNYPSTNPSTSNFVAGANQYIEIKKSPQIKKIILDLQNWANIPNFQKSENLVISNYRIGLSGNGISSGDNSLSRGWFTAIVDSGVDNTIWKAASFQGLVDQVSETVVSLTLCPIPLGSDQCINRIFSPTTTEVSMPTNTFTSRKAQLLLDLYAPIQGTKIPTTPSKVEVVYEEGC